MLILSGKMQDAPVMSLQTGTEIARTTSPIIDPAVLEITAYHLSGPRLETATMLLLTRDIREVGDIGLIIDSSDELVDQEDILRLQKIIRQNFKLIDMTVVDDQKNKLGKIYDYTIDPLTFTIHQLHIKRPLLKSLQTSDLIISRKQIIEINNRTIVVKSATLHAEREAIHTNSFINPFRKPSIPSPSTTNPR